MADIGTLRLLFLAANLFYWLIGAGLLGFVGWTLSTLPNTSGFMSGSFLILYAGIVIGLLIGLDGLLGCLGGMFGSMILLKLYVGFSVVFGVVEIALILTVYVQHDQIPSILNSTWYQVNDEARHQIQKNLKCCGIESYTEYGTDYASFPDSCFKESEMFNTILGKQESTVYTTSCLSAMQTWLSDNMGIWIAVLVGITLIQIISGMLSCQVFTRLHERCRIKPLNTDDKNNEESKDEEIQSSNEELNDLERKSDRNMAIDGASCRSPSPTEHDDNHKKTNIEVIAMVNLDNEENGQENISEKNIGDKHIDCDPEPNLERESKQCVIEDDTLSNDKKSNDYPESCSNEQSNTDDKSSDNKEHDTEKPDNPSDIMFHADTNKEHDTEKPDNPSDIMFHADTNKEHDTEKPDNPSDNMFHADTNKEHDTEKPDNPSDNMFHADTNKEHDTEKPDNPSDNMFHADTNKEHDTEKPDNPSDIMFHADTNKDNKEYINMDDHERGINKQNIEYNEDEEHTNSIESSKSGDLKISSSRCGSASSLGGHSQKNELRSNDDLKINPVRSSSVLSNENNLEQQF